MLRKSTNRPYTHGPLIVKFFGDHQTLLRLSRKRGPLTHRCPPVDGDLSLSQQPGYSLTDEDRACKSLYFNTPVNGDLSSCKRGPFPKPLIFQYPLKNLIFPVNGDLSSCKRGPFLL